MSNPQGMSPNQPYMLRAIYEWIADNHLTPHILVNAAYPGTHVPKAYVQDNKITFNIDANAVRNLLMSNDAVEFEARFGGVAQHIYAPMAAVIAIYALENGAGMVFTAEAETSMEPHKVDNHAWQAQVIKSDGHKDQTTTSSKARPQLRIIKKDE